MTKPAAPKRARRARTSAGQNPPRIADHLTRLTAMTHAVADWLRCCTPLPRNVLPTALAALRDHHHVSNDQVNVDEVVINAYADLLASHSTHPGARWGSNSDAQEALRRVVADSATGASIDDAVEAAKSDDLDGELMCWEIITCESVKHIGLIRKEASKLVRRLPDTNTDDLLGYGWAGLRAALRQYDPSLGYSFSTYACPKINGMIRDGVRSENVLPKRLTTLARAAAGAEEALTHQLSRTPTYEEILEYLKAKPNQVALLPRLVPAASLEELASGPDQQRELRCLIDNSDPAADAEASARREAVHETLAQLPELEGVVLRMLWLEERSMAEISRTLDIDLRTLRGAKERGMEQARRRLAAWRPSPVTA